MDIRRAAGTEAILVCTKCKLTRHLPKNWKTLLGVTQLKCRACDVVMEER